MLKIRALNRESSSDEEVPVIRREAQEEIALELYNKALRLQCSGELAEAEEILTNLINDNIPQLENNGGLPSSMSTLKYSCHFNIGNISTKRGNFNSALDNYLQASELDATDVTLWHRIGTLALKQDRFKQAAYAFFKGLECNDSHWPCLDQIISLLYAIRDTISCLVYIGKALSLDPEYLKGLVLRKRIHQDNPYTLAVYQKWNPDYIYEPALDVGEIDEEEEALIMKEMEILCDRIRETEKAVGPKPLQTMPLPKALEDFTWVHLGQVVVHLHQYITDNNMSHFTFIDISKCMSQKVIKEAVIEEVPMTVVNEPESGVEENNEVGDVEAENVVVEEKMEFEPTPERRPSQNSENNNNVDGLENTPTQTDNDDELPMEQDADDQDENNDNSKTDKNRSLNRANKRKRDLLSDLQIWGWHSKRKSAKKGKTDRDFTVEDALNRIIPSYLLKNKIGEEKFAQCEDSMNTMDIYNMYVEDRNLNILSPIHSPKSVNFEEYFNTDRERDDVMALWQKSRDYCDAIVLIREFVLALSKLWHVKWPKELVAIYIDAYSMYKEHYDHANPLSGDTPFNEMRDDALATLLYGELLNFSSSKSETRRIHVFSIGFLQLISGWQSEWKAEFPSVLIRVNWLRTHIFRREGNNDLAIQALELIQEVIQEEETNTGDSYFLSLPNCFKCGLVTSEITAKILKHLDMITSLDSIEELFKNGRYFEVSEILKTTFNTSAGVPPTWGKMGRPAQLGMLMHSLWFLNLQECFVWTEECLYEALPHLLKPGKYGDKWELFVENCIGYFYDIIEMETVIVIDSLSEEKRARLVETLAKIVCRQLNTDGVSKIPLGCITPWIILHHILVREEHRQQAKRKVSHVKSSEVIDSSSDAVVAPPTTVVDLFDTSQTVNEELLPPSVAILFSAHEFLGPKGWCLTGNGELLHFILDAILDRLDAPIFEAFRDKMEIHIEQALFCLYQHPSKKNKISRHLADHNVDPLPLTWERAFQLYDFYGPDCLPEFNSYKNASISSDLEQLLQRIIALVPPEMDPQPHTAKLYEFIHGKTTDLPEPIKFSHKVRDIYYLIGDYYFKQREFNRCIKYFVMDLCINPLRVDSWACIGLSYISQLENKLNYCKKLKNEMEFLDKAKSARNCFQKALDLEKDHIMLWIEFGSFEYMVHSFCSRVMKSESDTLSMEKFEYLENQKNIYLESSGRSFEKAIQLYQPDETEADERWLQYYILGKVAEKKQKEPIEYIEFYITASKLLHENNALYPDKINYHNPQHLSVEALELYYRINASVLKYLELHEGKTISNSIGNVFKQFLDKTYFPKTGLVKTTNRSGGEIIQKPPPMKSGDFDVDKMKKIEEDVKKCLDDILNKIENNEQPNIVIMISDSDDESKNKKKTEDSDEKDEEKINKNELELMDGKNLENEKISEAKLKSGSETETDVRTSVDSSPSSSSSSSSSSESDSDDDSSTSSSTSSSENPNENMSNNDISSLVDRCIIGLEQCVIRLPQNYKALYRLAHVYFNYKPKKDLVKCKQLFLGEYTCKGGIGITGLFSDRKNHNFFNGIWRIPSSEIDRPGSLSAHMSRCIALLLQILQATNDNKLLLDLSMQFRKTPDPDKIYIKDSERLQFADQAMVMCIQCFRSQIQNVQNMNETDIHKLLQDLYRSYQLVQKHETSKEQTFASMLIKVYKKLVKIKLPETGNILEMAVKFCQQNRLVEKQKKQIPHPVQTTLRGPGISSSPPVLPAPSTVAPSNQPLLKRPGLGRPRGRPPLPKQPGQTRTAPRGRSPNITPSYAQWHKQLIDQNATYTNYLKHYQDELIKQYSQSLSLTQLTQLSQYFQQNQFASSLAAQNQLLTQSSLSNPAVMKQMIDSGKKKKTVTTTASLDSFPNTSFNVESFLKTKSSYSKKNLPHTITSASQASNLFNSGNSSSYLSKGKNLFPNSNLYPPPSTIPFVGGGNKSYTAGDLMKSPKTTAPSSVQQQVFKEPSIGKSFKSVATTDKTANLLMKDRPNISITPVVPTSFLTTPTSSPGKTLQEKLADKQKQLSTKQLTRNIEAELIHSPSKKLSLSASKGNYKFPLESGISISQIPVPQRQSKPMEVINFQQKAKSISEINLPPNLPLSLSVRKATRPPSSDDDVILIE